MSLLLWMEIEGGQKKIPVIEGHKMGSESLRK